MLWEGFLVHYGWPEKILTDQGCSFESALIKELCNVALVQKLRMTPYRPQLNGNCKCFNATLISMLGTLPPEAKKNWSGYVSTLTHAYNCTMSQVVGYSPFYLMFGRIPILPVDVEFGVTFPALQENSCKSYADKLCSHLHWAYKVAQDINKKEFKWHKLYYDRKFKCMKLKPGDQVLVHVKAFGKDHKIADHWEQTPYEVVERMENKPVFKVHRLADDSSDAVRVLHRNMLFPLQSSRDDLATQQVHSKSALVEANWLMDLYFKA